MTGARWRLAAILLVALLPLEGESSRAAIDPVASVDAEDGAPPSAESAPRISRVYPAAPRGDEFVEVRNLGTAVADLAGWALTDLEGTSRFPNGTRLAPGAALVATRNATSYAEDVLRAADLTWDEGDAPRMEGTGLRLADDGDEVFLLDEGGRPVDAFVYGSSGYAGPGWIGRPASAPGRGEVAVRRAIEGVADHDDASDWEGVRAFRLGQSAFEPPPVTLDGPVRALVSPDDGAGPLLAFLASARSSVEVAVYTLTSESVGAVLADAARSGVRVRLLLEASPVGGLDDRERRIAGALSAAGADVRWLSSGADVVKRYAYLHAKYAIVDGEGVLVSSENFGSAGFPEDGGGGNRGWSVAVRDPQLASQLREVFDEDFDPARRDTRAAQADPAQDLGSAPVAAWTWPAGACCRTAQLLLGPDNLLEADTLLGLFDAARERIWIEAFYLEDPWGPWANPLLEATYRAARRGVEIRLLLDGGTWGSGNDPGGNEAVAAVVNARARAEGWPLAARLLAPGGTVGTLHNKGMLVDGRTVVVSSVNWARGSATENREVGLVLGDPAVVSRFEAAFRQDWGDQTADAARAFFIADPLALLGLYAFVAGASALSLRFLRPGDKGLRSRPGLEPRGPGRAPFRGRRREVRLLPPELVAEPRPRPRGGRGDRRGREAARGRLRGPEGDRG